MCDKINEEIKILKEENFNLKENFKKVEVFIKALTNENKELEKKIERILINWKSDQDFVDVLQREKEQIVMENKKLKELALDMWKDIPKTESCEWDSSTNTCIGSDRCIGECSYWYRMVKLGIEVSNE